MKGPTAATVKRLFAMSGNCCAFPKCRNTLVDEPSGKVIGQICHISARSSEGPRFDDALTDEQRHSFENLILLCPIHHQVIDDDPVAYTIERLQQMKSNHEASQPTISALSDAATSLLIANVQGNTVQNGSIIVSQNQMGGQIAHSITNNGLQPRRISKIASDQLIATLKALPSETISIHCVFGDTESFDLANNIKNFLEQSGWKIETLLQHGFPQPVKGLYVQTPADTPGINSLIRWLMSVGLDPIACLDKNLNKPEVIVGANL